MADKTAEKDGIISESVDTITVPCYEIIKSDRAFTRWGGDSVMELSIGLDERVNDVLEKTGRSHINLFIGNEVQLPVELTRGEAMSGASSSFFLLERDDDTLISEVLPKNYWGEDDYNRLVKAVIKEVEQVNSQLNGLFTERQTEILIRKLQIRLRSKYGKDLRRKNQNMSLPYVCSDVQVINQDENAYLLNKAIADTPKDQSVTIYNSKSNGIRAYLTSIRHGSRYPRLGLEFDIENLADSLGLRASQMPLDKIKAIGLSSSKHSNFTCYFIGEKATGNGNQLVGVYFSNSDFVVDTVDAVIHDWCLAVDFCRRQGLDKYAFVKHGDLFELSPDCIRHINRNLSAFPDLNISFLDNQEYVEQWLKSAKIGEGEGKVSAENWLAVLTGYTQQDNAAVPGLTERYIPVLKNAD
ncbi:MAG: hypothetical protein ABIG89_05435 [Candidatus Woesearchaeota archaeon]